MLQKLTRIIQAGYHKQKKEIKCTQYPCKGYLKHCGVLQKASNSQFICDKNGVKAVNSVAGN